MSTETVDLHGVEKQPFLDWREECTYVEAVTVPNESAALELLADEMAVPERDLNLAKVRMRWVENEGKEAWIDPLGHEYREGWLECEDGEPGSVPFWKDCP